VGVGANLLTILIHALSVAADFWQPAKGIASWYHGASQSLYWILAALCHTLQPHKPRILDVVVLQSRAT
jgi:hypothetical protein